MGKARKEMEMDYIDNDDYWARQWQLEAEAEEYEAEKQRIDLQNANGVDMPFLGAYITYLDFVDCKYQITEVPF